MKIVHLSVVRQFTAGQKNQLSFEYSSSKKIDLEEWTTLALHSGPASEPYIQTIPRFYRGMFMRNLYGWLVALRLSRHNDIVLMRHMTFDPFAIFFAPFVRNRVTVHHAKEIEELQFIRKGWKGKAASILESFTGRISARNALAILGVTQEIAEYERDLHASSKAIGVYSNGVDLDKVSVLPDDRQNRDIEVAFICGKFSEWHGLDKLITAVDQHVIAADDPKLTIHLIGSLSKAQLEDIASTEMRRSIFRAHGTMSAASYRPILARCDAGIASLALERKNLYAASTLKVREMLAMGLPIFSGHHDVALPTYKNYVCVVETVILSDLWDFAKVAKQISRDDVRRESSALIEKTECMRRVIRQFNSQSKG